MVLINRARDFKVVRPRGLLPRKLENCMML